MRTVTVRGQGSVSVKPDTVEINLSVEAKDRDYGTAVANAAERVGALERAVFEAGFSKDELRTTNYNVRTDYEGVHEDGIYKQVFAGYVCSCGLRLSFTLAAERLSAAVAAIGGSGAEPCINISFTVKNPDAVKTELLESISANARRNAEALCKASGARLGELQSVVYDWQEPHLYSPTRFAVTCDAAAPKARAFGSVEEAAPEDISLADNAAFTWELC